MREERTREVVTEVPAGPERIPAGDPVPVPPEPFVDEVETTAEGRRVSETERVDVLPDGSVERRLDRVEDGVSGRRRPFNPLVPTMLVLLGLVVLGGAAYWWLARDDEEAVPTVTGMPLETAIARLEDEGFRASVTRGTSEAPPDSVHAQEPEGGTSLDEGATVALRVSSGPATVGVPNAVGLPEAEARDRMAEAGLQVKAVRSFGTQPEGTVAEQRPAAGTEARDGATVTLVVSKGPATATVPNVVGQDVNDAQRTVTEAGFEANVVQVPSAEPQGTVVAQHPAGGTADRESPVRLNVSSGAP